MVVGHLTIDKIVTPQKENVCIGGATTYSALAAAKLGLKTGIVAKVGFDFSHEQLKFLKKQDIDVSGVKFSAGRTTRFVNMYNKEWDRQQRVLSACGGILPEDVPVKYFDADVVHFAPVVHEVLPETIDLFRGNVPLISMDPQGLLRKIGEDGSIELEKPQNIGVVLKNIDIVKSNRKETKCIAGKKGLHKAMEELFDMDLKIVIATLGSEGAWIFDSEFYRIPTIPVTRIVDPTGAGDAFMAGFIHEYLAGENIDWCGRFASCLASFLVESFGPASFPNIEAVEQRLQSLEGKQ